MGDTVSRIIKNCKTYLVSYNVLWIVIGIFSILLSDQNNPCQKTSGSIPLAASTWLTVYGASNIAYSSALILFYLFCRYSRDNDDETKKLLFGDIFAKVVSVIYWSFYTLWMIVGLIVFLENTLDCAGNSASFFMMVIDLLPLVFLPVAFIKFAFA